MKDLNELSKLAADLISRSMLEIINENCSVNAIIEKCQTDEDFKKSLFEALKAGFAEMSGETNKESVTAYLKGINSDSLLEIINEPEIYNPISERIIEDFFEDNSGDDIYSTYCSGRQQEDIKEYVGDEIYNDAIDKAISSLENIKR